MEERNERKVSLESLLGRLEEFDEWYSLNVSQDLKSPEYYITRMAYIQTMFPEYDKDIILRK